MKVYKTVHELVEYAISRGLSSAEDRIYLTNRILERLGLSECSAYEEVRTLRPLHEILEELTLYAREVGMIGEGVTASDLFDTALMGELMRRPSEVIGEFYRLYGVSPEAATDYFYKLSCDANYIRTDRIARDKKWTVASEYGEIDITINLSKPEKDPRAIAAAATAKRSGYPACLLCRENEGFAGTLLLPARQNLRQIPFDMAGARWYLQYSPYVYYNEHCIALSEEHTPMRIDADSFRKLLGFVTRFPHYFIGQNADLPIVGGSILSHDHMQGGRYTFAMERAPIKCPVTFEDYPDVSAGIVKWPMSVLRLSGEDPERLSALAARVLAAWRGYTDESAVVYAYTDGTPHNTITPIARRRGELYELDLVLRNNLVTEECPDGVYHPRREHHNIKKENIGLIEVMGLAVLPSRLKGEMEALRRAILSGASVGDDPAISHHVAWLDAFRKNYTFTEENTEKILEEQIGKTFVRVLTDAGVYKDTPEGERAFLRFLAEIGGGNK